MKKTTRMIAAGVISVGLLAATACSGSGGGDASDGGEAAAMQSELPESVDLKGETVASLFTSMNNDYYSTWDQGAKAAVEAFNGNYVSQTNEGDPATEIAQFQQQVDAGVKIIFITAPDSGPVPEIARIANENDVCLVNTWEMDPWDSPFEYGDNYTQYIFPDTYAAAYETATALFEEMGGKGNFVHISGHPGATPDAVRTLAVDDALKEYPDIELIDRKPGEWDRDSSRTAMSGVINRVGKDIDGVFGQNDDVAIGALNAMQEAGIEDVPITGMDGNLGTMDLIKSGDIFAVNSSLPNWNAGFSFVQALDACKSGEPPRALNRQILSQGILVTADNVDDYIENYTQDGNLPWDWVKMSRVAYPDDWDPQNGIKAMDMEEMWKWADKPAGYELPEEYAADVSNLEEVNTEWDEHWKEMRRD